MSHKQSKKSRVRLPEELVALIDVTVPELNAIADVALTRVLTGKAVPEGRLPFELPRSTQAVLEAKSDVPGGSADPLYPYGHGLAGLAG